MRQYQIAMIVGSLRRDSINRKLALAIEKLGPTDFTFSPVQINESSTVFLQHWMDLYVAWVKQHAT